MAPPQDLNPTEFLEWQEKAQIPTQRQILTIFTMWLEDHRLLEEEPHIARRLTEFLSGLKTYKLSVLAQLIIQTIERLVSFVRFRNNTAIDCSCVDLREPE